MEYEARRLFHSGSDWFFWNSEGSFLANEIIGRRVKLFFHAVEKYFSHFEKINPFPAYWILQFVEA